MNPAATNPIAISFLSAPAVAAVPEALLLLLLDVPDVLEDEPEPAAVLEVEFVVLGDEVEEVAVEDEVVEADAADEVAAAPPEPDCVRMAVIEEPTDPLARHCTVLELLLTTPT